MENNPNNLVALMMDPGPNQLVGLLGVLKSGCAFVPIDAEYPLERIDFMVRDSRIELLVTESRHLNKALRISGGDHTLKHIICIDRIDKQATDADRIRIHDLDDLHGDIELEPQQKNYADPGRIAYLVYTSGSTGKPKGVPITHENLFPLLQWSKQVFKYGEHTRTLQSLSFSFDFGIYEVLTTVFLGGTIYFIDKNQRLDPYWYAETVNRHAINTIHSTPSFISEIASCAYEVRSLEELHLGGEALMNSGVDQMLDVVGERCAINNWYGPSETTINSSVFEVGTRQKSRGRESVTVPIGKASAKNALYVLDRNGNLVAEGVAGELYIGGPGLAPGYLNRPGLTADRFIPSAFDVQSGARLYKTGDLVRQLPDGDIEFLGRLDHQVKVRGFRIELGEIEAALAEHECVREAVVLALEEPPGSKRLVAYIVPDRDPALSNTEIRSFLRQQLPDYMVPSAFVMLKSMPLTPNGKLDRRALPLPEPARPALGGDLVAPRSPSEEVIAEICAEVLGLEQIGINDNFFDLGCHSLLATKIVLRMREAFEVELPLVRLFEHPTVAGLAESLQTEDQGDEHVELPPIQPAPRDGNLPLSFAQERVWFLGELDPTSVSYHVPRAVRVKGGFSVAVFEQSFDELIGRHEILRTTFPKVNGRPVQMLHPPGPVEIRVCDLRTLSEVDRERHIDQHILAEGRRPFDLTKGPFLRLAVLQLGDQDYVFILAEHHLVHDGWTQGVLIRDFLSLYRSMSAGRPSSLAELPIQYADFAYWQRQWLQGEALDQQLSYWKQKLEGAPPVLDLPTDRPRPAVQSFRGAEYPLVIKGELAESLRAMSRRESVTLFMTMLAVFKTLLYRYTGQEDLVVGSWVANRRARETEGLLGMIINTILLRTNLSEKPSFRELLKRVRQVCLGAYAYQDLPFEKLVEALQPERSLSYNPLFQVLFAFQDTATPSLELPEMSMQVIEAHNQSAKFDLNVVVLPPREQLAGLRVANVTDEITVLIEYSTDLFERETIIRMAGHYQMLLESVVKGVDRSIADLEMLTQEERVRVIEEWNATGAEYPAEKGVNEMIEEQVERSPEEAAVIYEDQQLSYGELNRRANQFAHYLEKLGVGPEVQVAICVQRSLEMVIGLLGVLKAGGAYVPMDPGYPGERLAYMLEDSQAQVVVTQQELVERLPLSRARLVCIDRDWERVAQESDGNPAAGVKPENLAYVIYTSGSTGSPKGVRIERRALTNFIDSMGHKPGFGERDVLIAVTSLSFDISMLEIFLPVVSGGRVVVASREAVADGFQLMRMLMDSGATHMQATPATWRLLVEAGWKGGAGMSVLCGGEALPPDLANKLLERSPLVWNLYGPTETTIWSSMWSVEERCGAVPIGRPIRNTQIYVTDGRYQPVPIGVEGKLYIAGAGVAQGYMNRADMTADTFVPNVFGKPGSRMYRTGDVARYSPDGELEYVGREDHQVKLRGYRIELGEIEAALSEHETVKQCVVIVREYEGGEKRLVGYVVGREEEGVRGEELRRYLRGKLPEYMVPWAIVELKEMPMTANGKLDRKRLPAPEVGQAEGGEERVRGRTPIEEIVSDIFSEVLGEDEVGVNENFFEIGGHSLLATQVISRVREALGVEIGVRAVFESPTVSGLARAVERERGAGREKDGGAIKTVSRDLELPLSYAQQRLWFIQQMEPESAAYNIPIAMRLHGEIGISVLKQSLWEVLHRHEALRTRFELRYGQPIQVIDEAGKVELALWDLSETGEAERETHFREIAKEDARRPFDLEHGPVWRASLVRLSAEDHVLLLCMHHVVCDGWSMDILVKEFTALYEAYREGKASVLPELPVQYADFAVWQREWLRGEVLQEQLDYWRRQLTGAPVLELPVNRPRPGVVNHRGQSQAFILGAELTRRLKELSQRNGVTLFMSLLAGFQLLLARYSGERDITVGTPIAGRTRAETEGLIGFFVNTLVMRTDFGDNPTVSQLLTRVRHTALGAYAHQELPFEKLVEQLQSDRSLSHEPLFQVMLILQNGPRATARLSNLQINYEAAPSDAAKFDMTLSLIEEDKQIRGSLEYASELYDRSRIVELLWRLKLLLEGMVANSNHRAMDLPMLSQSERRQIIVDWNRTEVAYPADKCVHELFEQQVDRTPDAVAVVHERHQLSYAELNVRANRLAHYLRNVRVGPEGKVGVCVDRSFEMVIAMIAAMKAGGSYVPLDPAYPVERLAYMVKDAGLSVLLTTLQFEDRVQQYTGQLIGLDTELEEISEGSQPAGKSAATPLNTAYVVYTSGSTGQPKGVLGLHQSTVNRMSWMWKSYPFEGAETCCVKTSLNFVDSVWEIFGPLLQGVPIVLISDEVLKDTKHLVETLADHKVTRIVLVPSLLRAMIDNSNELASRLPELKYWVSSGEELTKEMIEQFMQKLPGRVLLNLYGSSEVAGDVTCYDATEHGLPGSASIGRPVFNTEIYILSGQLEPTPIGVAGELYVGGENLARGYINRPELTAEKFVPNPFSTIAAERLYRTGDLGRYAEDGSIEYVGRIDHQVKVRGYRIELGEIEAALAQHEAVRQCAVRVWEDERGSKRLVAYVALSGERAPSAAELRGHLRGKLPEYMTPWAFVTIEQMPLTVNGKIDRRALPRPEPGDEDNEYVGPRTPVEEVLCGVWAKALGIEQVGVRDNFFELGGDSILSIQVIARAREAGVDLTPRQFFEYQTIAELAEIAQVRKVSHTDQGVLTGPVVLTPIQQAFFEREMTNPHHFNQAVMLELKPQVDDSLLERILGALLLHHDALRLRFEQRGRQWFQGYGEPADRVPFSRKDLSQLPAGEQRAALEADASRTQASLSLCEGLPLRAVEYELGDAGRRLLLAAHVLAIDEVSWQILLEDMGRAYEQLAQGDSVRLAPKTASFRTWTERLQEHSRGEELKREGDYWLSAEWEQAPPTLPVDEVLGENTYGSARIVSVWLTEEETRALLQETPDVYQTDVDDVLLTALAQAYSRWTGERSMLIELEGQGRDNIFEDVDLSRTVGWFTTNFPVRLRLDSENPEEALKHVKEQLGAIPNNGLGYGLLRYLSGDEQAMCRLRGISPPEIGFTYLGQFDKAFKESLLFKPTEESAGPRQSIDNHRRHLLDVTGVIVDGRMRIDWTYSENIHRHTTIETVADCFAQSLRALITHCQIREARGLTPADFPDLDLTQDTLDKIRSLLGTGSLSQ